MRRFHAALLALALGTTACGSTPSDAAKYFSEEPVGSKVWKPIDGEPAWVANPPRRDGVLRHVMTARSDFRELAGTPSGVAGEVKRRVTALLTPVAGADDAARAADAASKNLRLVKHACKEEHGDHPEVVGDRLVTAWWLAEVPLDPVIASLPEAKRVVARASLR